MNTNSAYISQKVNARKSIYSITPFTLLDFPDKTACIIWFAGCNMRCAYCCNPDIVLGKGKLAFTDALKFLATRKNLLDGVVLSGGECTLHSGITILLEEIKNIGMAVKVDTNGTRPLLLQQLISGNLIHYVALDFKATAAKFKDITKSNRFNQFEESLGMLVGSGIPFEVRTTVHSELLTEEDIKKMVRFLEEKNYKGKYYLQNYVNDVSTLGKIGNARTKFKNAENLSSQIEIIIRN